MPTQLLEVPAPPPPREPRRKVWNREECAHLEALGLLDEQHFELVEGELIDKMGKKRPHVNGMDDLADCLCEIFGRRRVNREAPIDVAPNENPTNEPEPDVIVLKRDRKAYLKANPQSEDLQLVVEVSDSTLLFDLTTKAGLYARAGIIEYWVLDVIGRKLIVHHDPRDGHYSSVVAYGEGESIAPLGAPGSLFRVMDAFPA